MWVVLGHMAVTEKPQVVAVDLNPQCPLCVKQNAHTLTTQPLLLPTKIVKWSCNSTSGQAYSLFDFLGKCLAGTCTVALLNNYTTIILFYSLFNTPVQGKILKIHEH